jgi:hypothetical protein
MGDTITTLEDVVQRLAQLTERAGLLGDYL